MEDSSKVLLSTPAHHHQQGRRKVGEEEEVTERKSGENAPKQKRTLDDLSETNKSESKRMRLGKLNNSNFKLIESNDTDHRQKVFQTEIVKEIQTTDKENETIDGEKNDRANSEITKSISSEVTENTCSELTPTIGFEKVNCEPDSLIIKELTDANKTLTVKENELEQLNRFIKCKNEELNKIKLSLAEEEVKKTIKAKEILLESLNNSLEKFSNIKEVLANKEVEIEQLKKDLEDNNRQLTKIKNNNVQLKKISRFFGGKLSLAEEEIKRILDENKALDATIKSLKEEKSKLEIENQLLKSDKNCDNISTNDDSLMGRTGDVEMNYADLEAVITQSEAEMDKIRAESIAMKKKLYVKEERYQKVLTNAKAKLQKMDLERRVQITITAENEQRAIKVSPYAIMDLENGDLRRKLDLRKKLAETKNLQVQFGQPEEIHQRNLALLLSTNCRKQVEEKEEDAMKYEIKENEENIEDTKADLKELSEKNSFPATPAETVSDELISDVNKNPFPECSVTPMSDENHNGFLEKKTFPEIHSEPTSDETMIQRTNSPSNWRIIFMDCEKISDGNHTQITQIGCYVYQVSNRRKSSFFLSMYPTKHKEYLQMKQKSDLLKTLHLTLEQEIGFQFANPDGEKIKAVSETDGFENFLNFLGMSSEGEDNVLFLNSAQCILPLLFNKIGHNLIPKYVAGICELSTFLSKSLGDNHLADMSHMDDIYRTVMGKSFEEITPTCSQTSKYMFKIVEKVSADQGNSNLNFESFISKYFLPTSHFIKKFAHLDMSGSENESGDTVSLEIETSFRPGFSATVEMCRVDLVDLTEISDETPQCRRKKRKKNALKSPKRVLAVGNYELEPVNSKTMTILVEFEGIAQDTEEVSLGEINASDYRCLTMERWFKEGASKAISRASIKVIEGKYGFLEVGLTRKRIKEIKSTKTDGTHKISTGDHILNYAPKSKGSIPLSYEEDLDEFIKCNEKDLHTITNLVDENMSALLLGSSRNLPSNITLPEPVPARKITAHKVTVSPLTTDSVSLKVGGKSESTQNETKETSNKYDSENNSCDQPCNNIPSKESCSKNSPEQICSKNPAKESRSMNSEEHPCTKYPSNLDVIPRKLRCSLCCDMLRDAVILPCCMLSACDACAWEMLLRNDFTCRLCM